MTRIASRLGLALALILLAHSSTPATPDIQDTRLLSQPAVSDTQIAFIYCDDLWVADLDGKNPKRLTTDIGVETLPVFSPDGKTIAFSAQYDGNIDVYTIPSTGGPVTRLTWHPGPDLVRGFSPDGKNVLFSSGRSSFTNRFLQLFSVPLTGGMPTQLPLPSAFEACYSPDGESIAYTPLSDATPQWKHYRGGRTSRIWIYNVKSHHVEQIPQPESRCNDLDPHWIGETIYFRSDRNGEYNVFSFDTKSKSVTQLTKHQDFPVLDIGSSKYRLIYEQGGYLHLFDLPKKTTTRLKIGLATDLLELRPRYVKAAKQVRGASLSPSGARAVFEMRGEIVTVPAAKGDARNLTNSPGVHERSPVWSPDGKSVAYFSDEGGEYHLVVHPTDGKEKPKSFKLLGAGFYEFPVWSPDSKKLTYVDNSQSLFWIDLDSGKCRKIASEAHYVPSGLAKFGSSWSPDSKWVAYSLGNKAAYHTVFAYDTASEKSKPITDGLSDARDPNFDASGKYLYFFSSTDAGPVNNWFAQSNNDMQVKRAVYLAVLKKGTPSPLTPESDEEKPAVEKKEKEKEAPKAPTFDIDFDGIDQRVLALPIPPGDYQDLQAGSANQFFYLERGVAPPSPEIPAVSTLHRFDLTKRKSEPVTGGVIAYDISADGKKALYFTPPDSWLIVDLAAPVTPGKGKLNLDAVEIRIDPKEEFAQMFDEAWRINRDYFYDPGMHGADWPAVKKKYAEFLPHLACRSDLDRVIRWMLSELAVGHSYSFPGERMNEKRPIPGGLLGADYEIANGRYRFKKVYGGLNWTPELRSPLTVPGVDVKAGEYLLAVRGIDLKPPTELFSLFENSAGKQIEITVGPNPDGAGSRTVTVEPLRTEDALRNRDWVEGNLKKVHEATKGRVAYVYLPNTAGLGHAYFKRYFFPQADKDAIILDERFNGGGQIADYYIDHLRRPFVSMWATRYGDDQRFPGAAILGPKVMLIDETAGSGGDMLPWMFRKFKMGPLVGRRTWGGLVGILGFPVLMDGARVTAPNIAIWNEDGFIVENVGVPPDIEVEQLPAEVIAGKDPQLDKAIEIVLKELDKTPPEKLKRPAFPIRVRKE